MWWWVTLVRQTSSSAAPSPCPARPLLSEMGGAYLTLLNTIANVGIILPKSPIFAAMDATTVATCR